MENNINNNIDSDMEYSERAYTTSEVAVMLDIAVPTVRKYAQSLESKGYEFIKGKARGKHKARLYLENDVSALRYLKDTREKGGISVDQSTSIVIERFGKGATQSVRSSDIQYNKQYGEQYNELKKVIHKQDETIKTMIDRLDQYQEYIDNRLNQHEQRIQERDQMLMQTLKETLETKKQIAAVEEKKSFFARLFRK